MCPELTRAKKRVQLFECRILKPQKKSHLNCFFQASKPLHPAWVLGGVDILYAKTKTAINLSIENDFSGQWFFWRPQFWGPKPSGNSPLWVHSCCVPSLDQANHHLWISFQLGTSCAHCSHTFSPGCEAAPGKNQWRFIWR